MLRNVELTAPYFHNGGEKTLNDVVDFYFRGGNHQSAPISPPSPTGGLLGFDATRNTQVVIKPIGTLAGPNFDNQAAQPNGPFVDADKKALVAFLLSMTVERVKYRRAPFDHPQLFVPDGERGDETTLVTLNGFPIDQMIEIPAVGRNGGPQLPKLLGLEQTP